MEMEKRKKAETENGKKRKVRVQAQNYCLGNFSTGASMEFTDVLAEHFSYKVVLRLHTHIPFFLFSVSVFFLRFSRSRDYSMHPAAVFSQTLGSKHALLMRICGHVSAEEGPAVASQQ